MAANLSWLDASPEEQRKVREIVRMFSQRETQDEMGARRIVVALSDALFPGTSVLHSRARYLFFIPWLAQKAAKSKYPERRFEGLERSLIAAFLADTEVPDADRTAGLIGVTAGPRVKQLPSVAYWTALQEWGLLEWGGTIAATLQRIKRYGSQGWVDDHDELSQRHVRVWHAGIGEAPEGFLDDSLEGGFRLQPHEAALIKELWLEHAAGSLLEHLVGADEPLQSPYPWTEPHAQSASSEVCELLDQAERFSLAIHGPQLLYALMLAERYIDRGYDRVDVDLNEYRHAIDVWADDVTEASNLFDGWAPTSFWELLTERGVHIDELQRSFFTTWIELAAEGELAIADNPELRLLVRNREQLTKPGSGRLQNDALLASWGGGRSGITTYRWGQVQSMVNDVITGLGAI
jgi:hypothetical protein